MKNINSKIFFPHILSLTTLILIMAIERTGNPFVQFILIILILAQIICLFDAGNRDIEKEISDALKEYEKNRS